MFGRTRISKGSEFHKEGATTENAWCCRDHEGKREQSEGHTWRPTQ